MEIELDPLMPQEWKEIEDEESEIALILFKQLGSLAVLIYKRIDALKIIEDVNASSKDPMIFLKPVLQYYEKHTSDYQSNKKSQEKID